MTKHRYDYTVTDIAALQAAYPKAVQVEFKPVRAIITKLLDCGIEVPGIEHAKEDGADDGQSAPVPKAAPEDAHAKPGKKLFQKTATPTA